MATFTINFANNTNAAGNFCIFQRNPSLQSPNDFTLAWRVEHAGPHTKLPISWNTEFYFFWAKPGTLMPGVIFNAGEAIPTSLTENNAITLTKLDGNYKFIGQKNGNQQGVLSVVCDNTMPLNQASVGIGMSGAGTFAVQAQPNMNFVFSPNTQYWIAFGDFQQGQVLDTAGIDNPVQIVFPNAIFSMNATLNADRTWTITQGMD